MKEHQKLIKEINRAKKDNCFCDEFIRKYIPFIKSEVSKFLGRPVDDSLDDEYSIGMIAFYEALISYNSERGAFLSYASIIIKSRLIDNMRKEKRHSAVLSLDSPVSDDEAAVNFIADNKNEHAEYELSLATKEEIEELVCMLKEFGVSLSDVADNCPRQKKTLDACRAALEYAKNDKKAFDDFLRTKRLPLARISKGCRVERKTLERHRKYLVALFLIQTNGYEIIRGHINHVLGG